MSSFVIKTNRLVFNILFGLTLLISILCNFFLPKKYFNDALGTFDIETNLVVETQIRTGKNVVAFIDNKAAHTVVLGAHLDHLGYNQDKNALDINNDIRNGADDNASGTAALIELAKALKKASNRNDGAFSKNNYLMIHF